MPERSRTRHIAALLFLVSVCAKATDVATWSGIDVSSRSTRCNTHDLSATPSPDHRQLSLILPKELARSDGKASRKNSGRCVFDLVFAKPLPAKTTLQLDMRVAFAKSRDAATLLQVGIAGGLHRYELKPQQVVEGELAATLLYRYIVLAPRGTKTVRVTLDATVNAPSGHNALVSVDSLDAIISEQ